MKVIERVFNNRIDWLNWRHTGIGSSDACVLMNVSRFKKPEGLLIEKVLPFSGEDQANEYIKERGNKIEVLVRDYYSKLTGKLFTPANYESQPFNFMRASLDGITNDTDTIIEIKLLATIPNPNKINKSAVGYMKFEQASRGEVPLEYIPQIQHQLMVTGAKQCVFLGFKEVRGVKEVHAENLVCISVKPDVEYINKLSKEEFNFWWKVNDLKMNKGELD